MAPPNYPKMNLTLSASGLEQIEVRYLAGKRQDAWTFCREMLAHLEKLDAAARKWVQHA